MPKKTSIPRLYPLKRAFAMQKHEIANEMIKAAPPLAVVGTSVFGLMTWQDAAYAATALWFVVQTAWFVGVRVYRYMTGKPLDTVQPK